MSEKDTFWTCPLEIRLKSRRGCMKALTENHDRKLTGRFRKIEASRFQTGTVPRCNRREPAVRPHGASGHSRNPSSRATVTCRVDVIGFDRVVTA